LNGIKAMACATIREARRMRALHVVLIFAIAAMAAVRVFKAYSPGEEEKFIIDTGVNLIRLFGLLSGLMLGAMLIPTEVERKTIHVILSKPVTRGQFLLGKFLGASAIVVGSAILMMLVFFLVYYLEFKSLKPDVVKATLVVPIELLLFVSIVTFVSTFAGPIFVVLFAVSIWIMGHVNDFLAVLEGTAVTKVVLTVVGAIVPHFDQFDLTRPLMVAIIMSYGYLIFNEREF